ncbi:MAG: S8 family serine peptidase [Burkholderiales bacterium]
MSGIVQKTVRAAARASLALTLLALAASNAAQAATLIDAITIKYRNGALPLHASELPARDQQALGHLRKRAIAEVVATRDGAIRLAIDPPMDIDDARAAINRVRMNPDVLYAGFAQRTPAVDSRAAPAREVPPIRTLMVKFRDPAIVAAALADRPPPADALQRVADAAHMPVAALRSMFGGAYVLQLFTPVSSDRAATIAHDLALDDAVEWAEEDAFVRPALVPNDPCYAINTNPSCFNAQVPTAFMFEWNFMAGGVEAGGANLAAAWDVTTGSPAIRIGLLDTGYLYNHPDLAGRAIGGYDFIYDFAIANDNSPVQPSDCTANYPFVDPFAPPCVSSRDSDPSDPGDWIDAADQPTTPGSWFRYCGLYPSTWHGAHSAGIIGALSNNATGIAGVNWRSKIVPLRVIGKCGGNFSDVADALAWGAGATVPGVPANPYPARVLGAMFSAWKPCGSAAQSAVDAALALGAVIVVPAGNSNDDVSAYLPANCNGVIAVAATQRQGLKASYSNSGSLIALSAPGGGARYPAAPAIADPIVSTINNGTTAPVPTGYYYDGRSGTSAAAAHVAGVASLMLSRNPKLTAAQVAAGLETTARAFPFVSGAACGGAVSCNCFTSTCGAGLLDAGAAVAAVTPLTTKGRDLNADGKDDLVWRSTATGAAAVWLMNGTVASSAAVVYAGPNYSVTHTGDFNGDGKTDLVFRSTTGQTAAWLMNGTGVLSSAILMSDPNWIVLRTADFDGDGKRDLLWHNTFTGQTAIWLMNGLAPATAAVIFANPAWVVTQTGDFNGDGKADLVWRNDTTGQTAIWLMNGVTPIGSGIVLTDPAWTVTHVADLDGDGKSDLVWRRSSGLTAAWRMNGTAVIASAFLSLDPSWTVTHVGDFNGDGKSDLVWRNTSFATKAVLMDGFTALGEIYLVGSAFNEQVTHVADVNGDGLSDALVRDYLGAVTVQLSTGTSTDPPVLLLANPDWIVSPPDGL